MVYKEIEIDSTWQQPLGEIRVIQEEADGRELRIYLYDNGSPLDLTGENGIRVHTEAGQHHDL